MASGLAVAAAVLLGSGASWAQETRIAAAGPANDAGDSAKAAAQREVAPKLEAAAELGVLDAQLKLARVYATGPSQNLEKAFNLYRRIIEDHADARPRYEHADSVAQAIVALANYYRTGIPGVADVDKKRAAKLLHFAASYYGNPDAQCDLAQMYLNGEGVARYPHLAVNWLAHAAKKRSARAQAMLGELLWRGADGVPRETAKGLALLSLARQNASNQELARWVEGLYTGAYDESDDDEREGAAALAARWQPLMGAGEGAVSVLAQPVGKPDAVTAAESGEDDKNKSPASGFTNVGIEGPATLR